MTVQERRGRQSRPDLDGLEGDAMLEGLAELNIGPSFAGFRVFVVGGAVRDALLGEEPTDVDLLAVPKPDAEIGRPAEVLANREGMTPIDPTSSFPVFIDDEGREVALPRTEESTGTGFRAFDVRFVDPSTPVEEAVRIDLERRDLTINAIAFDIEQAAIVDPFGGVDDLRSGLLQPVSETFAEDPVRVLRVARFAATMGFGLSADARDLAGEIVADLRAVPGERIALELHKTFDRAAQAGTFIRLLDELGATRFALPELLDSDRELLADRLDSLDGETARIVALGAMLSERRIERLVNRLGLSSVERDALRSGQRDVQQVIQAGTITDAEEGAQAALRVVERVDGSGATVTSDDLLAVGALVSEGEIDRKRAERRFRAARAAREEMDATALFDRLGIEPSDLDDPEIGIDGEEFGRRLRFARRALTAAAER